MRLSRFFLALLLLAPLGAFADDAPSEPAPSEPAPEESAVEAAPPADSVPAAPPALPPAPENPNLGPLLAAIDAVTIDDAGQPFLWKVTSKKKKHRGVVYVTGSIHLGQPGMYPLHPAVDAAFDASSILAVEMDLTDPEIEKAMSAGIQQVALLPESESLSGLLAERYAELTAVVSSLGMPMAMVDPLSPFMVAITLQMVEVMGAGWTPELGIDEHFLTRAKADGKTVLELEGLDRQLAVFTDMSLPVQVAMLESSLDMRGATAAWTDKAWQALSAGDAEAMVALRELESGDDSSEYAEFERLLLGDRNVEMTDKLVRHIQTSRETMFVVVGAMHVPGDDGLIALLHGKKSLVIERVGAPK